MAKILNGNLVNSVKTNNIKLKIEIFFVAILLIIISVVAIYYKYYIISLIALIIWIFYQKYSLKKLRILKAGYVGEEIAKELLLKLPNNYTVISDVTVAYQGHQVQIDHLILTPTKIFILEIKNYAGILSGKCDDKQLTQTKTTSQNVTSKKSIYNPIMQVKTHARVISNILVANGYNINVEYGVYFVGKNFKSTVNWNDENIFLVANNDEDKLLNKLKEHNLCKKYDMKKLSKLLLKSK